MRLKITSVDAYGFNGREHHPQASDIGLEVLPIKMDSLSPNGEILTAENLSEFPIDEDTLPEFEQDITQMWTAVTSDGRVLELMEHEVVVIL